MDGPTFLTMLVVLNAFWWYTYAAMWWLSDPSEESESK